MPDICSAEKTEAKRGEVVLNARGRIVSLGIVFLLIMLQTGLYGEQDRNSAQAQELKQRVAELEKTVAELRDANSMLMENLMNCVEENAELENASKRSSTAAPLDPGLVRELREVLRTDADLQFLQKLEPAEAELLLELTKKRLDLD